MTGMKKLLTIAAVSGILNACGGENNASSQLIANQSQSPRSMALVCGSTAIETSTDETANKDGYLSELGLLRIENEEHYQLVCLDPIQRLLSTAKSALVEQEILPNTVDQNAQLFCSTAKSYAQEGTREATEEPSSLQETDALHQDISQTSSNSGALGLQASGYSPDEVKQILQSCPARYGKLSTVDIFKLGDQSCGTATNSGVPCTQPPPRPRPTVTRPTR